MEATLDLEAPRDDRSLLRDERGAMMVLGLLMAVFLVGILYYMVGVGQAIVFRERMQDAVDAGSFTGAVLQARAMNIIVFFNMIMAAAVAVLIALKVVQLLLIIALVIVTVINFIPGCWGCMTPLMTTLGNAINQVQQVIDKVNQFVEKVLKACNAVQKAIILAWPVVTEAFTVSAMLADNDRQFPHASFTPFGFGFGWPEGVSPPIPFRLPLEEGTFSDTCDEAANYVGDVIAFPISFISEDIADKLSGAISGLVRAMRGYFCEDASGDYELDLDVEELNQIVLPQTDEMRECREGQASGSYQQSVCDEAASQSEAIQIGCGSMDDRECDPDEDCCSCAGAQNPELCETVTATGWSACNGSGTENFHWQELDRVRKYTKHGSGDECYVTHEDEPESEATQYLRGSDDDRPCATMQSSVGGPYAAICPYDEPDDGSDVGCGDFAGTTMEVTTRVVRRMFSCTKEVDDSDPQGGFQPPPISGSVSAGAKKGPMLVMEDIEMGATPFQVWGFFIGPEAPDVGERGVTIATWGRGDADLEAVEMAAEISRFSVAQAEFFFNDSTGRDRWMWEMRWRARLRRIHLPDGSSSQIEETCTGDACSAGSSNTWTRLLSSVFLH